MVWTRGLISHQVVGWVIHLGGSSELLFGQDWSGECCVECEAMKLCLSADLCSNGGATTTACPVNGRTTGTCPAVASGGACMQGGRLSLLALRNPSEHLLVSQSVCAAAQSNVCLCLCLSVCLSVCLCVLLTMSVCASVCPCICLSVCLSVSQSLPACMCVSPSQCLTEQSSICQVHMQPAGLAASSMSEHNWKRHGGLSKLMCPLADECMGIQVCIGTGSTAGTCVTAGCIKHASPQLTAA